MTVRGMRVVIGSLALLSLLAAPQALLAQECEGDKPRGGRWATSGELYLDRANKNADPQDRIKLFNQALEVLIEGFLEQADNPRNYKLAGEAYAGLNDYVGADSVWAKAEKMWSCYAGTIDTLRYGAWIRVFNSGVRYSQSGDLEKAERAYKEAWTVYKRLPQPMLQLGALHAQRALAAEVEDERKSAQSAAIEAYKQASAAMETAGDRLGEEQRQTYGRAAAFNLAQLLALDERFEEAAAAYEVFLAREPDNIDAKQNAAVVLTRAAQKTAQAADELEAGPEKDAHIARADSLQRVAAVYYDELLARDDLEARDYHNIGLGFANMGDGDQAVAAFKKALEMEPYRENTLEQLAMAYFQAQEYDSLLPVAQKLVERYPLSMNNLALLANSYREIGDAENALAVLEGREAMSLEITNLDLEEEEGVYTLSGFLHNMKQEPGTSVDLQFDFYNDAGELVTNVTVTVSVPEQGGQASFSTPVESEGKISGFTYRLAESGQQAGT